MTAKTKQRLVDCWTPVLGAPSTAPTTLSPKPGGSDFIRALAENVSLSIHYGQRLVDATTSTTSTTSNASRTPAAVLSQPSSPESLSRGFTYTKDRDQIRQYLLDCTIRARAVLEEVGSVLMALDRLNDEWAHIQQGVPSEDRDVMSESMAFAFAANRVLGKSVPITRQHLFHADGR
jgi:hypothetical protein